MPQKFSKGPAVYLTETDISEVSTATGTSTGAFVGRAKQGPVNRRVLITNDQEFVQTFGKPDPNYGYAGYGILEFMKESNTAYFVRPTSGTEGYAHVAFTTSGSAAWKTLYANSTTTLLATNGYQDGNKPNDILDINSYSFSGELFTVASIGPGTYGNNLAVSIITSASDVSAGFDWRYKYDTNQSVPDPIWSSVFKINVFLKDSTALGFNAVSANPVETFYVSRRNLVDSNGNNLYLQDAINGVSKYIYVRDNTGVAETTNPVATQVIQLLSGADNNTMPAGSNNSGWGLFNDPEKVSVQILVCTDPGDKNSSVYTIQQTVANLAASRMDAIALLQVDGTSATVLDVPTITANAGYDFNVPCFAANYVGWQLVYDKFTNRNLYLPLNIFAAAIYARTDNVANVWSAPAGPNRATLSTLGANAYWSGTQIGLLRDANLNTTKQVPGRGQFIIGQRTAQRKETKLSNVHVRRLLNFVEKTLERSLYPFMFEPNTASSRLRAKTLCEGFLNTVAAGGGFNTDIDAGFMVECSRKNNSDLAIQNGQFNIALYVKPVDVIEFILLNTIITKNGISFQELQQ